MSGSLNGNFKVFVIAEVVVTLSMIGLTTWLFSRDINNGTAQLLIGAIIGYWFRETVHLGTTVASQSPTVSMTLPASSVHVEHVSASEAAVSEAQAAVPAPVTAPNAPPPPAP